ncbi:hypothetical protein Fmac_011854 [Flemingia macrophylla]|uniref:Uncharacterized protein n=1 Tax=Flemingia macrophylla TaxID=520843 RepID=A0ABD1MNL7_9FABA
MEPLISSISRITTKTHHMPQPLSSPENHHHLLISNLEEADVTGEENNCNDEFWSMFYDVRKWEPSILPGFHLTWVMIGKGKEVSFEPAMEDGLREISGLQHGKGNGKRTKLGWFVKLFTIVGLFQNKFWDHGCLVVTQVRLRDTLYTWQS